MYQLNRMSFLQVELMLLGTYSQNCGDSGVQRVAH